VIKLSLLLFCSPSFGQSNTNPSTFEYYFQKSKEESLSQPSRIRHLKIAYDALKYSKTDSLKYSRLSRLVVASSHFNDSVFFQQLALEGMELAKHTNNPSFLADAHWNYAAYYLGEKKYDSSYYHYDSAYKIYTSVKNTYYAGKMLYNMAYISSQTNNFTGAEILLFRSIKNFEVTDNNKQLYLCYNLLGTNADDMEEYEKALKYYNKAATLLPQIENSVYYQLELWNNMGVRLQKLGQYNNAISFFNKALNNKEILATAPSLHAKLLDNKAFSFICIGKYGNVISSMEKAQSLRDSIADIGGSIISRLRFAIYYAKVGDTVSAIDYAKSSLQLAETNHLTRDVLQALELLAILDTANKTSYLQEHIALDKSQNARDRNLRNKFTAIQYETDKYIRENEQLFKERLWISVGSIALILILILIYLNARQRAKNKELLFEQEQQLYNEDMFLMAMEQKTTLERGRRQERLRISEELHDGILARLFAIRFKWPFIDLKGNAENLKQHKDSIDLLTGIETEIRNISHDLRNELIWDELEFKGEIENTIKERSEIGHFKYSLVIENAEQWESLDYLHKINICRMLDEILQNVIKHARATMVGITFGVFKNVFVITVSDNGKGFNKHFAKKGIGLKNLKNRAKKLNGVLKLSSKIGQGTKVEIRFLKNN
jgi:signal transduction histidine kinase